MKSYLPFLFFFFIVLYSSAQSYSPERRNVRIGEIGDGGKLDVPKDSITSQLNIDFTGYRDVALDQLGARISALRFNNRVEKALVQNTGLAFYTNPLGMKKGDADLVERMRITPYGNIGIGIANAVYLLHVNGSFGSKSIRIGEIGDGGNLNVIKGALASQLNLDFTGYRDSEPDQIGARISALRFNNWDKNALVQNVGLAFYTNPIGWNKGIVDLKERMRINPNGYVGIGTLDPKYLLDVAGTIRAGEVKVEVINGADFVFDNNYKLLPLHKVESFVKENKHLPEIPSEKKMQEEGLNMNEFQIKLLQKIEELTLYIIDQDKRIQDQESRISNQDKLIKQLGH